jgi:anthraniloyl-CoA monooxygenase
VHRPLPDRWPLLAPTDEPYTPRSPAPHVMSERDRDTVADAFAAAAHRAAAAGVKALFVDCADGYLLASFLSPLTNPGGLEERLAFPLAVIERIRDVFDGLLGLRLTCDDRVPGGITPTEAAELARRMHAAGCDLIDVAAGGTIAAVRAAGDYRRLYLVGLADTVRNEAGVPVLVGGRITTLDEVSTVVAAGRADLCVLDPRRYLA